jgi:hypothetical protein
MCVTRGTYSAQYSLQLANIANTGEYADIWFRKNGTNIVDTGKRYFLPARKSASEPSHVVGAYETLIVCSAGDYIEVAGSVSNTDVSLETLCGRCGGSETCYPCGKYCGEARFTFSVFQHFCFVSVCGPSDNQSLRQ